MRLLLAIGFFVCFSALYAQERYSKVKVFGNAIELSRLQNIALDHIKVKKGEHIIGIFSEYELGVIRKSGLRYEVLIDDVTQDYLDNVRNKSFTRSSKDNCSGTEVSSPLDTIVTPLDFSLGTMGGFLKYEEMLAHLDNMAAKYPNLITVRRSIVNQQNSTDYQTQGGRPIYWVKISDHVSADESSDETQILYSALHHAREPASLSQLIFYMYYLLENYGKSSWVTHIVNSREMIFVPCVNPDGYIYNQTTNPNGGGMWRKNRRANAGGSFGVDLNRNYSYQWGVSGTSSDPNSDVYKGLTPFSETETKAMRSLCQQFNFKTAFNYHTHGDLLLFPFGYGDVQATDHDRYTELTEEMVAHNNYVNEQSVLLYPAAGDSDDYMYGNTADKPRIFAMTPEVGDDFWFPQSGIIQLCKETLWQNISMALQADVYPLLKMSVESLDQLTGQISFSIEARGLNSLDDAQLSISSHAAAFEVDPEINIGDINPFQTVTVTVPYEVEEGTPQGTPFDLTCTVSFNNGKTILYNFRMIWKGAGAITGHVIFGDDFTTSDNWAMSGTWGVTSQDFASGPSAITDSPTGNYNNFVNMKIDTRAAIDLRGLQTAFVSFKARWNIETDDDYVQFTVIKNNVEYPVCGNYSRVNASGKIVYDGNQNTWVQEQINLADFLGSDIKLRFRIKSDGSTTQDGFYLDDLSVIVMPEAEAEPPTLLSIYPEYNTTLAMDAEIELTFSENIIVNENEIILRRSSDQVQIPSTIELNGKTITIRPGLVLDFSTQYYLDITPSAVADLNGNYFSGMDASNWTVTTISELDEIAPQIEMYVPSLGAVNVETDQIISATFSEPILISAETIKLMDDDAQDVSASVSMEGEVTLTITPVSALHPGVTYTIHIPEGSIKDISDNHFEGLSGEWTFSTVPVTAVQSLEKDGIQIFPNPSFGELFIRVSPIEKIKHIQLIDMVGKTHNMLWDVKNDNTIEASLHAFPKGIYILRIINERKMQNFRLEIKR